MFKIYCGHAMSRHTSDNAHNAWRKRTKNDKRVNRHTNERTGENRNKLYRKDWEKWETRFDLFVIYLLIHLLILFI